MIGIKKLNYCLFTLILSTSAISAVQAQPNQGRCGGWYVEAEGIWGHANETLWSNYPYALSFAVDSDITATDVVVVRNTDFFNLDRNWRWGGRIALGYDFPSCDYCKYYGVSLEYTHFDHKTDTSVHHPVDLTSSQPPVLFPTITALADFGNTFADAHERLRLEYDTVDLLGHKTVICGCSTFQAFAGARYLHYSARVDADYGPTTFVTFAGEAPLATIFEESHAQFRNRFEGAGPRVGTNMFYSFGGCFGITGQLAGSIVYGETRSSYDEFLTETIDFVDDALVDISTTDFLHHHNHSNARFVPNLSGKIGLAYRATFCNCSSFTVEVGYRGDKYFGVSDNHAFIQSIGLGSERVNPFVGNFIDTQAVNKDATYHDFEFNGPYLTLTYHA